jgi:SpoVK/Ycf46/Vps4 family AAA+-type ATPase
MTRFTTNMPDTAQQIVPVRTSTSEVLDALNNLVGLAPVKEVVHQLVARQRVEQLRAGKGMKVVLPSPHLVFTGNPGTGKTTVAHLVGELYSTLGILKKGHVVEVNRSGLVAAYVGQTALKTRAVCTQALGGVLFIDEAYSLLGDGNDFGAEAIEELLTFMEAHRGEFVVVAAGYPEQMETFLSSNPGLRSRFDTVVHFPDFNDAELLAIFEKLVAENEYTLRGAAVSAAKFLIKNMDRGTSFGNGREMRRLFHQVLDVHAMRLNKYERPGTMMLNHLSGIDFFPMMNVVRERKRAERVGTSGGRGYGFGGYL